jgi:glycosyltransferase involved in cell wall biosynthesis
MALSPGDENMIKATVILLAYNHEKYIVEALSAIAMQTRPADEIIIVDDASSDATPMFIEAFIREHPTLPIRFLRNPANLGVTGSYARAVAAAVGDVIFSAAGDDVSRPERLDRCLDYLAMRPTAFGVITDAEIIDDVSHTVGRLDNCAGADQPISLGLGDLPSGEYFLRGRSSCGAAAAYRSAVFREFSSLRADIYAEDDPAAFRAMLLGGCDFLPIALTRWRRHGNNLSHGAGSRRGPAMAIHYRRCEAMIDQMLSDASEWAAKQPKASLRPGNALANLRYQKARWALWAVAHEAGVSLSGFLTSARQLWAHTPAKSLFFAQAWRPLVGMLTPFVVQGMLSRRRQR